MKDLKEKENIQTTRKSKIIGISIMIPTFLILLSSEYIIARWIINLLLDSFSVEGVWIVGKIIYCSFLSLSLLCLSSIATLTVCGFLTQLSELLHSEEAYIEN